MSQQLLLKIQEKCKKKIHEVRLPPDIHIGANVSMLSQIRCCNTASTNLMADRDSQQKRKQIKNTWIIWARSFDDIRKHWLCSNKTSRDTRWWLNNLNKTSYSVCARSRPWTTASNYVWAGAYAFIWPLICTSESLLGGGGPPRERVLPFHSLTFFTFTWMRSNQKYSSTSSRDLLIISRN